MGLRYFIAETAVPVKDLTATKWFIWAHCYAEYTIRNLPCVTLANNFHLQRWFASTTKSIKLIDFLYGVPRVIRDTSQLIDIAMQNLYCLKNQCTISFCLCNRNKLNTQCVDCNIREQCLLHGSQVHCAPSPTSARRRTLLESSMIWRWGQQVNNRVMIV